VVMTSLSVLVLAAVLVAQRSMTTQVAVAMS
jgi:hypothetical protein